MPPTTKPQVKKKETEEGKAGKKAKKAVAAALLLLFVALAAFVHAQNTNTGTKPATAGNASKIVKDIEDWTKSGVNMVVTLFGLMFWAAVGITIFHIAMSYLAPTRHHRLGFMVDAVERMKDVAIGLVVLFILFYGVMATGSIISGNFSTEQAWELFAKIVSRPFNQIYQAIFGNTNT